MTKAPQPRIAFQDFEKQLALVILPAQEPLKGKEKRDHPWSSWPGSQAQASVQAETLSFILVFSFLVFFFYDIYNGCNLVIIISFFFYFIEGQIFIIHEALLFVPYYIYQ